MEMEVIEQNDKKYTGCFIFCHGATRSGKWTKEMFLNYLGEEAHFKHIKIIFPTSPVCYSKHFQKVTNVWFTITRSEDKKSPLSNKELLLSELNETAETIKNIIKNEEKNGIPLHRIVIGGISQGGIVAAHNAYCFFPEAAGCIMVSSFIAHDKVFEEVQTRTKNPPLFIYYGVEDEVLPVDLGRKTHKRMVELGVSAELQEFLDTPHELSKEELECVYNRVKLLIPDNFDR